MECAAAKAFKTKFWPETTTTTTAFKPIEDFWVGAASNGVDEFLVDEFLDFSKDEQHESQEHKQEQQEQEEENRDCESVSSQEHKQNPTHDFSQKTHLGSEFNVPTDEMADLEWLSHFVDDSFSEFDPTAAPPQFLGSNRAEPVTEPEKPGSFHPVQVPARPRTKRSRAGSRVWPNATAVTATSTVTTTTTTPTSSSASSSSTSCLIFAAPSLEIPDGLGSTAAAAKRQRRNLGAEALSARRCSHCGSQKTPQWRAGPRGAKTLCNACGVRFKSGRLLPEYRPACSPTFSSEIHSNSHRKVLEMRRKKEVAVVETGVAPPVQSF
ncbi:hypothetical protein Scep_020545 [Stephania cephalantha]|uniref:GATA transcription factor n=1 Tax=Stephania cephalantha TaxID=152367 RepID=A0AAP0IDX3_9MAGN